MSIQRPYTNDILTSVCACDVVVNPLFADFKPLVLPDAAVRQCVWGGLLRVRGEGRCCEVRISMLV